MLCILFNINIYYYYNLNGSNKSATLKYILKKYNKDCQIFTIFTIINQLFTSRHELLKTWFKS